MWQAANYARCYAYRAGNEDTVTTILAPGTLNGLGALDLMQASTLKDTFVATSDGVPYLRSAYETPLTEGYRISFYDDANSYTDIVRPNGLLNISSMYLGSKKTMSNSHVFKVVYCARIGDLARESFLGMANLDIDVQVNTTPGSLVVEPNSIYMLSGQKSNDCAVKLPNESSTRTCRYFILIVGKVREDGYAKGYIIKANGLN
jgi:hypothetical protein